MNTVKKLKYFCGGQWLESKPQHRGSDCADALLHAGRGECGD